MEAPQPVPESIMKSAFTHTHTLDMVTESIAEKSGATHFRFSPTLSPDLEQRFALHHCLRPEDCVDPLQRKIIPSYYAQFAVRQ